MESNTQTLLTDVKRLLDSAKEDYQNKRWDNHSYLVSEFNKLVHRAKNLGMGRDVGEIRKAENDQVIHTSWSSGTPYNPQMVPSVGTKTQKLREVLDSTDKLFREISPVSEVEIGDFWQIIHRDITGVAKSRFDAGHFADAVETAFKRVNENVKDRVKRQIGKELDGASLMNNAFSPNAPVIIFDDLTTESGRNIQQGFMQIFAGSMTGIRNPKAHGVITIDRERAIHFLFLASLLMHKIDEAN